MLLAIVSVLRAAESDVPPELHGILATGRDHRFALVAAGGGRSDWAVVGEAFDGWKLEAYLAADDAIVLSRDNRRVTVYLKPSAVETGTANNPTGSSTAATIAAADDVLDKMKFDAMWDRIAEEQRKSIVGVMRQQAASEFAKQGLPEQEIAALPEKMGDAVVAGLQPDVMRQDFARIFAEVYTKDEMRGMANFYETAAGKAWTTRQPEVQQKLMQAMMPRVLQGMPAARKVAADYFRNRAAAAANAQPKRRITRPGECFGLKSTPGCADVKRGRFRHAIALSMRMRTDDGVGTRKCSLGGLASMAERIHAPSRILFVRFSRRRVAYYDDVMIEDSELLRRYAEEKSEEAFAALVQRHLGLVYACALRRVAGDAHMAEDVTQQVFTDVARRATELRRRPVLAGWLFTSTRFAASKAMRTAKRRLEREQEAHIMQELSQDATARIDWKKARPVLDDAIDELSDRDREAVLLRYFEGRDFSSVGAKLNLTDNAARMRVERALEKLRTRLARRGITSTAAAIATVLGEQAVVAMPAGLAASVTSAALAGGAIAGGVGAGVGALAAFGFMTKVHIGVAAAVVGVGATGFVIQAQSSAQLRSEVEKLRQQNHEIASLRAENQRLENVAAETAALRQADAEFARLRDEAAALQESLRKTARPRAEASSDRVTSTSPHQLSDKTSAAFSQLKPLQNAKDWAGMIELLDRLMSEVEPTSYDMAIILDMKAKLYVQQNQLAKAIEPWEKALQLSDQFKYFDGKRSSEMVNHLAQLRLQQSGGDASADAPQALWF